MAKITHFRYTPVRPGCHHAERTDQTAEEETNVAKYRGALPQLGDDFFMTDGGLETTLIFLEGQDLPHFAAFLLLETPEGEGALRKYFRTYAELARRFDTGLVSRRRRGGRTRIGARNSATAKTASRRRTRRPFA
jgi:hypothetical protein